MVAGRLVTMENDGKTDRSDDGHPGAMSLQIAVHRELPCLTTRIVTLRTGIAHRLVRFDDWT